MKKQYRNGNHRQSADGQIFSVLHTILLIPKTTDTQVLIPSKEIQAVPPLHILQMKSGREHERTRRTEYDSTVPRAGTPIIFPKYVIKHHLKSNRRIADISLIRCTQIEKNMRRYFVLFIDNPG